MDGRNHRSAVLTALLLALVTSVTSSVEAQSYASALFQQGVEALRENRYSDAETAFTASYAAEPHAATLCNLALAYERWGGHTSQAISAYDRCASEDRTGEYADHARERSSALRASMSSSQAPPTGPTMMPATYPTAVATTYPTNTYGTTYDPGYQTTYGWLAGGIVASVLGVGAIITGFILAADAYAIDEELYSVYPNLMIPETLGGQPNPDVDLLDRAKLESGLAVGMWIGGGVFTALGAFLIGLHIAQPAARPPSPTVSIGPGGISARFLF